MPRKGKTIVRITKLNLEECGRLKPLKGNIVHEACLKGFSLERAVIQPAWKALKVREAKGHFTLKASESL